MSNSNPRATTPATPFTRFVRELFRATPLYLFLTGARAAMAGAK